MTKATGVDTGYSLIGVISFGDGCGTQYGVSTEFSHFLNWVALQFDLSVSCDPCDVNADIDLSSTNCLCTCVFVYSVCAHVVQIV